MLFWRVPAPNESLLISGAKSRRQDTQFRIVTGHGAFVLPVIRRARTLSLALQEAEIVEDCITNQGIRLNVRAVAAFKVGDDPVSIANAARRFLSEQDRMETLVGRVFAGHLRSIVGGLTVEQIIRERDRVAQEVIEDSSGYINNLAAPHAAAVSSQARIAQARADQQAAEQEQQAEAMKAQYTRDLEITRAGFLAETEEAKARAAQAGPLAEARASQEVIEQQTALARRRAELAEQQLQADVRRPADAEAYRQRAIAEAERDKAKFAADAEAYRTGTLARAQAQAAKVQAEAERDKANLAADADAYRASTVAQAQAQAARVQADSTAYAERTTAEAEAEANKSRADSLASGNQELIAASRIVEMLPDLVTAAAQGLAAANLTVLNGTDGVSQVVTGLVGQGMSILDTLRASAAVRPAVPIAPADGDQPASPPESARRKRGA